MSLRIIALALLSVAPVAASAATVSPLGGEVRVSTGQGFQTISAPTEFAAGAQVMVSPGGSASIAYANDCIVAVKPAGIAVVQGNTPCRAFPPPSHFGFEQAAAVAGSDSSFGFTPKVGGERKTSAESPPPQPPPAEPGATDDHTSVGTYCLIGGVVVGAGVLAAILISNNDSASP